MLKEALQKTGQDWLLVLILSRFRGSGRLGRLWVLGVFSPFFKMPAALTLFSQ